MGFYKQREDYNLAFAIADVDIQHNQPVSGGSDDLRRCFFRINDEEELIAAAENWMHIPVFVMVGLVGGLVNKKDSVRQINLNTINFLTKIEVDPNNPVVADAISNAYDITFEIMQRYIKHVWSDFEDDPGCGPFKDIDPGKFKWQQEGPLLDQFYGWSLTFSDEQKYTL